MIVKYVINIYFDSEVIDNCWNDDATDGHPLGPLGADGETEAAAAQQDEQQQEQEEDDGDGGDHWVDDETTPAVSHALQQMTEHSLANDVMVGIIGADDEDSGDVN